MLILCTKPSCPSLLLLVLLKCHTRHCPVRLSVISLTSFPVPPHLPHTAAAPLAFLPMTDDRARLVPIFELTISSAWNALTPDSYMDFSLTWFRSGLKSLFWGSLPLSLLLTFATLSYHIFIFHIYFFLFKNPFYLEIGSRLQKSSKNKASTKKTHMSFSQIHLLLTFYPICFICEHFFSHRHTHTHIHVTFFWIIWE